MPFKAFTLLKVSIPKAFKAPKDFVIAEEIIEKAEKTKKVGNSIALSDIVQAYKRVMKDYGVEATNENHYYAMMIKLSLNKDTKTWRESLNLEKKVTLCEFLHFFFVEVNYESESLKIQEVDDPEEVLLSMDLEFHQSD